MAEIIVKPALTLFKLQQSGRLAVTYSVGHDANNRIVWTKNGRPVDPGNKLNSGFDYIQIYDSNPSRLRASSFVWSGLLTYTRGESPDIILTIKIHTPIVRTNRMNGNYGEDGTKNFYGQVRLEISTATLFDRSDGCVRLANLELASGNLGGEDTVLKSGPFSLGTVSTTSNPKQFGGAVAGTYAGPPLADEQFAFLRSLFRNASSNIEVRQGFGRSDGNPLKITLQPMGLNRGYADKRPFDCLGFATSISVGPAGSIGSATLALDPDPRRARVNPRIEFSEPVNVHIIPDVHNARTGYSRQPDGDSTIGENLFWYVLMERVPASAFVQFWNEMVANPYLGALRTVADGGDLSFVPRFEMIKGDQNSGFDVLFDLVQPTPKPNDQYDEDNPGSEPAKRDSGWHDPVAVGIRPHADTASFIAYAVFPGLITHDGKVVRRRVKVTVERGRLEWFDSSPSLGVPGELVVRISTDAETTGPDGNAGRIRVGALDLEIPKSSTETLGKVAIHFSVTFSAANPSSTIASRATDDLKGKADRARLPRWGDAIPRITATIQQFHLDDVRPGSQDSIPDAARSFDAVLSEPARGIADEIEIDRRTKREKRIARNLRREAPIVFLDRSQQARQSEYFLTGQEITQNNLNRKLSLTLRHLPSTQAGRREGDPAPMRRTVVIDREPFTVALVNVPAFELSADESAETDGEIANWETSELEGGRWEIARIAEGFDLFFPPQAIGEAAEKGAPWKPISKPPGTSVEQAIDYRLGTLARLRLSSSYFRQRYAEAPWNLRRVLGYAGQRAPGAGVSTARFEFLYGLAARFTGSGMRVAELGSRIGAIRDPLPARPLNITRRQTPSSGRGGEAQTDIEAEIYDGFRDVAAAFCKAYNTRIAFFEVYREGSDVPLSLEENVAFTLRVNGDVNADLHPEPWNPFDVKPENAGKLRGGATWGFESRNIFDEVAPQGASPPESTRGQILSPSFSALGGTGFMRAFFANGKSRIVCDTRLGRTNTYALERIGRTGVFWNIAKHVIVYERTVLPADQFEADQRGQHFGRPVLRKVREYVDILEPERRFPEHATALKTRGFVEACAFRTLRIPVSGRWGHDVKNGWVVPLWKEGADPDIYPKPDLRLWLSAAHTDTAANVAGRFKDPSQVVFFTSTSSSDGDNPNLWPPHPEADFTNAPKPQPVGAVAIDPNNPDGSAPDDLMCDPLLRRCTFDIDTSGLAANIVNGRTVAEAIGAVVETVTMMRSAPTGDSGGAAGQALLLRTELERIAGETKKLESALNDSIAVGSRALSRLRQLVLEGAGVTQIENEIEAEIGRVTNLKGNISRAAADARQSVGEAAGRARERLNAATSNQWTEATSRVFERFVTATQNSLLNRIDGVTADMDAAIKNIDQYAANLSPGEAVVLARRIDSALGPLRATVAASLDSVGSAVRKINDAVRSIGVEFALATGSIARSAEAFKLSIENLPTPDWKQLVDSYETFHASSLRSLDAALNTAQRQLPRELKTSATVDGQNKIVAFLTGVRSELVTLHEAASNTINGANTSYAAAKTAVVKAVDDAVAKVSALSKAPAALEKYVEREITTKLSGALAAFTTHLEGQLDPNKSGTVLSEIYSACQRNDPIATVRDNAKRLLIAARGDIDKLRTGVATKSAEILGILGQYLDEIGQGIQAVENDIDQSITKATDFANTTIGDLERILIGKVDEITLALETAKADTTKLAVQLAAAAQRVQEGAKAIGSKIAAALSPGLTDSVRVLEEGYKRLSAVPTFQNPSDTLALVRAAGSAPLLPNLKFNRDRIAYFFDDARDAVKTTPVVALMNRLGDDLKALGIRLPTGELLDRLIPSGLDKVDFGKLFPDLGGLKLDGLFKNLRLPPSLNDNVKVTHGFDKVSLTAWAKAEAKSALPPRADVFALGPLNLAIANASFDALADLALGSDGQTKRATRARIVGDWELGFGGRPLVTLEQTKISFEDGKGLDVDIDPTRVRFDSAIKFLSDVIKSYGDPNSGFFLEMLEENGLPAGLAARIELPMPPLSFGAFSIWGLRFSSAFALHLTKANGGKGGDFALGTRLALGRKSEPFLLRVWILVGGGWLDTDARYFPATGKVNSSVSIGLTAGLGLDFAFGPCCGYVFVMLGAYAEFDARNGSTHLSIAVIFLVRGGIVILGRFNIGLHLLLELIYQDDGSAIGRGTLEVTFTICWCCEIKVRQGVTYYLRKQSGSAVLAHAAAVKPHYLDSFL